MSKLIVAETHKAFEAIEAMLLADGFKYCDTRGRNNIYIKMVNGIATSITIHMQFWIHER